MSGEGDYDVKRCAKCAAWIPSSATMCAYCNTTSPDEPLARKSGTILSMRHGIGVTEILIVANLVWFAFSLIVAAQRGIEGNPLQWALTGRGFLEGVWISGGNYRPSLVLEHEWWRLVSANFLHFGLWHIALNMFALRDLGRLAEQLLGPAKFLTVYLVSGIGCTLAMYAWAGFERVPGVGAGASGAICGLLGVLIVVLRRAGTRQGRDIARSLGSSALMTLAIGVILPIGSSVGHAGGALVGFVFGFFIRDGFVNRLAPHTWQRWRNVAVVLATVTVVCLVLAGRFAVTYQPGAPK